MAKEILKRQSDLKKEGVKAGVPDIFLAYPSKIYHGLFIEMKAEKGFIKAEQRAWIENLRAQKYDAVVCYNFEQAKEEILRYIRGGE